MNKKTFILGGILIILIILAYAYKGPLQKWQSNLGKPNNFLAQLDVESINRIEVVGEKDNTIERDGSVWRVVGYSGFLVKPDLVSDLLDKLKKATETELEIVSTNQEKKDEFKTGSTGIKIVLYNKDEVLADFIVGKSAASDYRSSYVSRTEISDTYQIKGVNLFTIFNRSDWRDRTIFSSEKNKITSLRLQYPSHELKIEKIGVANQEDESVWSGVSPYKFSVDSSKAEPILDIMSNLIAAAIPEQNFSGTGLEKHLIIIQAIGEGVDNTLMIGEENKEGMYYAKKSNSDNIYLITKGQYDNLDKKISDFR